MLLYQTNPVGVQLFSYVNTFFSSMISMAAVHVSPYALRAMLQNVAVQIELYWKLLHQEH